MMPTDRSALIGPTLKPTLRRARQAREVGVGGEPVAGVDAGGAGERGRLEREVEDEGLEVGVPRHRARRQGAGRPRSSAISCWIVWARCCTVIVDAGVVGRERQRGGEVTTGAVIWKIALVVGSTATLVNELATVVSRVAPVGFHVTLVPARGASPENAAAGDVLARHEVGGREHRDVGGLRRRRGCPPGRRRS